MTIRMTIRSFDPHSHGSIQMCAGNITANAGNKTWQGPGIPQNGGTVDVEFDAQNYVTKVTPVSEPSPGAEFVAQVNRALKQRGLITYDS